MTHTNDEVMVKIWDLPTRMFHWLLAGLFLFLVISGEQGSEWMPWHMRAGYVLSGLLLFRILWGFVGSHHARFVNFVRPPHASLRYLVEVLRGEAHQYPGHNPAGAMMVLALLLALGIQALTGLVTTDDVLWNGPLYSWVSEHIAEFGGSVHRALEVGLKVLVLVHVGSVLFHKFRFKEPLISAMLHGRKPLPSAAAVDTSASPVWAIVGLACAAGWIGWLWLLPI